MAEPTPPEPHLPPEPTTITTAASLSSWGTLEELLLACAVNRHGTNSWDSVAKELLHRTPSLSSLFTPHLCHLKFLDLKRRFDSPDPDPSSATAGDDAAVCLDELRRLRVAELKRELHHYDSSIVSLQLKVKKLKEEREREREKSVVVKVEEVKEEERENSADLVKKEDREIFLTPPETRRRNQDSGESVAPEGKVSSAVAAVAAVAAVVGENDSCNGSCGERGERVESGELAESVDESRREEGEGEGGKESSDVQSTASLLVIRREKKRKKLLLCGGSSSGEENQSPGSNNNNNNNNNVDEVGGGGGGGGPGESKSQPLVDFLDNLRVHRLGLVFERRLDTQESPTYKSLIREHIDLGIIKRRLEAGKYADCHTKFYRDLMLLVNNAVVYFAKKSTEYKAAVELRVLVTKHFQSQLSRHKFETPKCTPPAPLPKVTKVEADQADLKPTLSLNGPLIACRKRSSIVGKSSLKVGERKESALVTAVAEKSDAGEVVKQEGEKTPSTSFNTVTKKRSRDQSFGSRSSSRKNNSSSNRSARPSSSPSQKPSPSTPVSVKGENVELKVDRKKQSPGSISHKMKQGSRPSKDLLLDTLKESDRRKISGNGSSGGNVKSDRRKDQGQGSHNGSGTKAGRGKGKEKTAERKNIGRPPKRAAALAATGKRGREGGRDTEAHLKKRQRK